MKHCQPPSYTFVSHYGKFPRTLTEAFGPYATRDFMPVPDPASRTEKVLFALAILATVAVVVALSYYF